MAKQFRGFVPKPTKGELVAAAKEQNRVTNADGSVAASGITKLPDVPALVENLAKDDVGTLVVNETPAAPAPPPAPKKDSTAAYTLGKKYVPKTDRNTETWGKITKALGEGPKTLKELSEVVKGHGDFIGYMTRGGHIVPYVAQEAKA